MEPSVETIGADTSAPSSSSVILLSLLIPALALWYIYFRISRARLYELANKIPGPEGYPFIGNSLVFLGTPHGMIMFFSYNN